MSNVRDIMGDPFMELVPKQHPLEPCCDCCGHRPECGYHHASTPEQWDPVVGAGCMCPDRHGGQP